MGVGGTSIYTLGIAHIDISVPSEKSSLYTGVGYMMTILGAAFGYIVGGQLLNIYVDVDQLQDVALSPEDPRWVGGWWIGYLIVLPAAWLLIVPFLGFPKHLPGTAQIHAEKVSQVHHDGSEDIMKEKDVGKSFKDFPLSLKLLLKNPVFMCLTLTATSEGMAAFGISVFFTKFIENQYGKTASISSLIAAKCDNPEFTGISVENGATGNLSAPCNANYNCDRSHYNPVCGVNNVQYFSPCHAGCKDHVLLSKTEVIYGYLLHTAPKVCK
ncbi:UNVERIFIED_CONTAM: hypothetical protein FKN15_042464 [Acipenser sinensis]